MPQTNLFYIWFLVMNYDAPFVRNMKHGFCEYQEIRCNHLQVFLHSKNSKNDLYVRKGLCTPRYFLYTLLPNEATNLIGFNCYFPTCNKLQPLLYVS